MTRVLYTGAFRYPDQDAAAFRVQSVAALFEQSGCTVSIAGWEALPTGKAHYRHQGRDCYPQAEFRDRERRQLGRLWGFFTRGSRTLAWLRKHCRFDVIVAYNPPALFGAALLTFGKWYGVKIVLDNTEWYESEHLPGGRFGPAAFENWLRMRVVYPRFKHVICISSFLERRYARRNVVRIPPLWPHMIDDSAEHMSPDGCVRFIYAGDAGRKDLLTPFIRSLPAIRQAVGRKIVLCVAGSDATSMEAALRDQGLDPSEFMSSIECHGRVSRERVAELYRSCHFSILFREDKRYARAGFPTKAAESWALGCPLLTNRVGDVGHMAEHMVDAIVVDMRHIADEVTRALSSLVGSQTYCEMSRNSRRKAIRFFTSHACAPRFGSFVQRLVGHSLMQQTS